MNPLTNCKLCLTFVYLLLFCFAEYTGSLHSRWTAHSLVGAQTVEHSHLLLFLTAYQPPWSSLGLKALIVNILMAFGQDGAY